MTIKKHLGTQVSIRMIRKLNVERKKTQNAKMKAIQKDNEKNMEE